MSIDLEAGLKGYESKVRIINTLVEGLVSNRVNSLILSGGPGIGKSFNVMKKLGELESEKKIRVHVYKGHITPFQMYCELNAHRESEDVIVFDDCDDVLYNVPAMNLLKACSELVEERKVTWDSFMAPEPEFIFKGKVIVITNASLRDNPHFDAVIDRMHVFEIKVSFEERFAKIVDLSKRLYDIEFSKDIVDFISENQTKIDLSKVTIRTFMKLIELKMLVGEEWKMFATEMGYVDLI